jgi:hypothetical protein
LDGLLAQDRDPGLELGRLDVGEQAPLEPAAEPVFERHQAQQLTVFVHHHRHLDTVVTHLVEQVAQGFAGRHKVGRAHQTLDPGRGAIQAARNDVLGMEDADDMVGIALVDGYA